MSPRTDMSCYDPDAEAHDLPTYPWQCAPANLATRRQLALVGLRPGTSLPDAYLAYRAGGCERIAHLWDIDRAVRKRPHDQASKRRVEAMLRARRTCPTCRIERAYYIPRRWGWCLHCQRAWEAGHTPGPTLPGDVCDDSEFVVTWSA